MVEVKKPDIARLENSNLQPDIIPTAPLITACFAL
jgi:hypothetical protein